MHDCFLDTAPEHSIPLIPVIKQDFPAWQEQQSPAWRRWLTATSFTAKPGSLSFVPNADGALAAVIVGMTRSDDPWVCADLPTRLPAGQYHLVTDWDAATLENATIGWGLGAYRFDRYKTTEPVAATLVIDAACDRERIDNHVAAISLVRDLINTPAEDMMPEQLAAAITTVGQECGASVTHIVGEDLLAQNYPTIHRVGRASAHAPRLVDLRWGEEKHPKLTLVGKGVCFDSGGLDLKPASGMRLMKKDMGGAAHVLGLARMVMRAEMPVHLRVLVAAVENAVSGDALRPGDIITSRQGITIEVDNTDAEGRLILCDALAEGCSETPDLLLDFATLTGAARVALGTDLPAMFCNNDDVATGLLASAAKMHDPIWRMPLHAPYRTMLDSKIADIANSASVPFAGAITAALFLQEFIAPNVAWAHFDIMAWNRTAQPGRPEGGEAMGIRGIFAYLQERFGA